MTDITLWYPMIIPVLLWVLELILAAFWQPALFRSGLPLFHRSLTSSLGAGQLPDTDRLNKEFVNLTYPSLLFHKISDNEILFREAIQARPMGYAPIVRGRIYSESHNPEITITGRMNWMMVLIIVLVIAIFLYAGLQVFEPIYVFATLILVLPAALSITGGFQISRFKKVAQFVSELNAES